jgi:hypothetical protein
VAIRHSRHRVDGGRFGVEDLEPVVQAVCGRHGLGGTFLEGGGVGVSAPTRKSEESLFAASADP